LLDRKGRRISLLIAVTGTILSTLSILLVGNEITGLYSLLIGSLFEGLSGGFFSLIMACHAYAADCSLPTRRYVRVYFLRHHLFFFNG